MLQKIDCSFQLELASISMPNIFVCPALPSFFLFVYFVDLRKPEQKQTWMFFEEACFYSKEQNYSKLYILCKNNGQFQYLFYSATAYSFSYGYSIY